MEEEYQGPAEHIRKMNEVEEWFQNEHSKVMESLGVSFAFGEEQLAVYKQQQRAKGYQGEFISLGYGQICRTDTVANYKKEFNRLMEERKVKMREVISMDQLIDYELSNHECYYTGNYYDWLMVGAVHDIYPEAKTEDFLRVYKENVYKNT